jgi:hypothetical protein
MLFKKFASEIFAREPLILMLQRKRNSRSCATWCQTNGAAEGSELAASLPDAGDSTSAQ